MNNMITTSQEIEELSKRTEEAQLDEIQDKLNEVYKLVLEFRCVKRA